MKPLKNKLDERLNYIQFLILQMGDYVEQTILCSCNILLGKEGDSKNNISGLREREEAINTLQLKISRFCFKILAKESPVAKDLRFILAIINTNTDLERMGDLAFNITERAQLVQKDPTLDKIIKLFESMFLKVNQMVQQSLNSFVKVDEKQARQILIQDEAVNQIRDKIRSDLEDITILHQHLIKPCIDLIIIAGEIERIADHTTNIAEEIIFLKTGNDIRHQNIFDEEIF